MFSQKLRRFLARSIAVLAITLVAGFVLLRGQPKTNCFTPTQAIQISLDGSVAAYVSFVRPGGPTGVWAVTVLDLERGKSHLLEAFSQLPKVNLSPSGRFVAAAVGNQVTIFNLESNTSSQILLPMSVYELDWLPQEDAFIVQAFNQDESQFWRITQAGERHLLYSRSSASWSVRLVGVSPTGEKLLLTQESAYGLGPDLYELDLQTGNVRFAVALGTHWYPEAVWSEDSSFVLLKGSVAMGGYVFSVVDMNTGLVRYSGGDPARTSDAAWFSPTEVAYTRYEYDGPSLWIWDIVTNSRRKLVTLDHFGYARLLPFPGGIGVHSNSTTPWRMIAVDSGARQLELAGSVCQ